MERIKLIISVDDDFATNLYNQMILKEHEISEKIITLNSGSGFLAYLENQENPIPEIVLLDLNMPLMNGWEVLDAVQNGNPSKLQNTKIFLLTSSPIVDDIERAKQHPLIHGVLMKPLQPDKILESIKNPFVQ